MILPFFLSTAASINESSKCVSQQFSADLELKFSLTSKRSDMLPSAFARFAALGRRPTFIELRSVR